MFTVSTACWYHRSSAFVSLSTCCMKSEVQCEASKIKHTHTRARARARTHGKTNDYFSFSVSESLGWNVVALTSPTTWPETRWRSYVAHGSCYCWVSHFYNPAKVRYAINPWYCLKHLSQILDLKYLIQRDRQRDRWTESACATKRPK